MGANKESRYGGQNSWPLQSLTKLASLNPLWKVSALLGRQGCRQAPYLNRLEDGSRGMDNSVIHANVAARWTSNRIRRCHLSFIDTTLLCFHDHLQNTEVAEPRPKVATIHQLRAKFEHLHILGSNGIVWPPFYGNIIISSTLWLLQRHIPRSFNICNFGL